nr:hypothetical protein [Oryza sativa Japonica Group]
MHPDGPKLHATTSESQVGQVPVRTGGMRLMTYSGGTTSLPDQVMQEWQQTVDAQFANMNNMMQQQHDDLQAYFRFQGFNPYQGP